MYYMLCSALARDSNLRATRPFVLYLYILLYIVTLQQCVWYIYTVMCIIKLQIWRRSYIVDNSSQIRSVRSPFFSSIGRGDLDTNRSIFTAFDSPTGKGAIYIFLTRIYRFKETERLFSVFLFFYESASFEARMCAYEERYALYDITFRSLLFDPIHLMNDFEIHSYIIDKIGRVCIRNNTFFFFVGWCNKAIK